jgi:anti-sigma B factor antagonist
MTLTTRSSDSVAILEVGGRFDAKIVPQARQWLDKQTSAPPAQIVVNLSQVSFIDSLALATLVQALKQSRQHGGDLHLCGLQQPVRTILILTRLDGVFKMFDDENEAIDAFN